MHGLLLGGGSSCNTYSRGKHKKGMKGFLSLWQHWCFSGGPQPYVLLFSAKDVCDASAVVQA